MRIVVTRECNDFVVRQDATILEALRQLETSKKRVVAVVGNLGNLVGTFSDGDFRRWLFGVNTPDLNLSVGDIANHTSVYAQVEGSPGDIAKLFGPGIDLIPLVDSDGKMRAIAFEGGTDFMIAGRRISPNSPTFIIAEIGINHNGDMEVARQLVRAAAEAGADSAKFQMRDLSSLYRTRTTSPGIEDLGAEYTLDLLAESSLNSSQILELMDYALEFGLIPLCTPWDLASVDVLAQHDVAAYKIASADLTNSPLLESVARQRRPMLVSTGMSTENEIRTAVKLLQRSSSEYALLHCQSAYPPAERDINLKYMIRLAQIGECLVGYSSHDRGSALAIAAVAMGARIIEKHITLDRRARGVDHVVSLEPEDFTALVTQIRMLEDALGSDAPRELTQGEKLNRLSLAKSLVAARNLKAGQVIENSDLSVRAPGRGLQPNRQAELIGKNLTRPMMEGDFFYETDILGLGAKPRDYFPRRPWGLPVRFHDWRDLSERSNLDFLEFHLSYRDLEIDYSKFVPAGLDFSLVVHSPDLFRGDLILDLCSEDNEIRMRSVQELQRVLDLTNEIHERFEGEKNPLVVASLGGSSLDAPIAKSRRPELYERIAESLDGLRFGAVTLLAQTLPPFPWYLGGQRFCNLFVDPEDTAHFAQNYGVGLCLDIAHTKLACNFLSFSFFEAVELLAPLAGHLHLVDAAGLDREGLQINEGEVDWKLLIAQLNRLAPDTSFIPEIWQGHVDSGRGFWTAMDRLEPMMRNASNFPL